MSHMVDYIQKLRADPPINLEAELLSLIKEYNERQKSYLFVYSVDIEKAHVGIQLDMNDFYAVRDLLAGQDDAGVKKIDFYIETGGGSAIAVEEIVKFLHKHFDEISFVVSGEAKSAGTILVLSGNEIYMTETGSLGPIDAQVPITLGRSWVSAADYMDWVNERIEKVEKGGRLNQVEAVMFGQISPGELRGVYHALNLAGDLVGEWLPKYKFRNWKETESGKPVDDAYVAKTVHDIVEKLIGREIWRSHGRSIKIEDMAEIGLRVHNLDADYPELAQIVYKIQTVCRFIMSGSSKYKIFATEDKTLYREVPSLPGAETQAVASVVPIDVKCLKCDAQYKLYARLAPDPRIEASLKAKGYTSIPQDLKMQCASCGTEMDLTELKKDIKAKTGREVCL